MYHAVGQRETSKFSVHTEKDWILLCPLQAGILACSHARIPSLLTYLCTSLHLVSAFLMGQLVMTLKEEISTHVFMNKFSQRTQGRHIVL